jgi:flagellar hook-length control protein FliK
MVDGSGGEPLALLPVQTETPAKPSQPAGSVWESYFVDFASPEKPGRPSGQPTAQSGEMPPVAEAAITNGANVPEGMAVQSDRMQVPEPEPKARDREDRQDVSQAPAVPAATQALPQAASAMKTTLVASGVLAEWSEAAERVEDPISGLGAAFTSGASSLGAAQLVRADLPAQSVIPQVAAQLAGVILKTDDNSTTLALAPEELGKVHLRLETDVTHPDRMVVMITVERPETLDLFRRHASELVEALRDAGYSGADIGFGQHDQSGGQDQQNASGWAGRSLMPEEPGQISTPNRPAVGASLDLRL